MIDTVSYITSQYPEFHETFIARELEALRRAGVAIRVYSLKTPPHQEHDLYPEHRRFIHQAPFLLGSGVILANLRELLSRPGAYVLALLSTGRLYWRRPGELLKALSVFPKTVSFASGIRRSGGVLHAHWATIPTAMACVVRRLTGLGFSFTAHAWDIFLTPPNELRSKIALANGLVTCTGYNVDFLRSICRPEDREKIRRNYHGLDIGALEDLDAAGPPDDSGLRAVAVGRLVEQKGFIHLVHAVRELGRRGVPAHVTLVGEGPLSGELEAAARGLPQGTEIEFAGRQPHRRTLELIASSHTLVAPSVVASDGDRDGIPNVLLEAMACRRPVVGSSVSGLPEVVLDGETGWLVPPGDAMALADALERIWRDPATARRLGQRGRRLIEERFDVSRNVAEFLRMLESFHATSIKADTTVDGGSEPE